MKKIGLILGLLLITAVSFAQTGQRTAKLLSYNAQGVIQPSGDTAVNVDTSYMWNGRSDNNQWNVSMQFVCTQLTGTVTPSIVVQGSNDATRIITGTRATLSNNTVQAASNVNTGTVAGTTYTFCIPLCQYKYLRVRNITAGATETSILSGTYWSWSPFIVNLN